MSSEGVYALLIHILLLIFGYSIHDIIDCVTFKFWNFVILNIVYVICSLLIDVSVNGSERRVVSSVDKSRKYLIILFSVLAMLFLPEYAYADDAVIGRTPAGVYPMMDAKVEMVSEEIVIDMDKNTVECTFEFRNTGEARDVPMGFPGKLREELGSSFSDDVSLSLDNFRTFVNGEELPVNREKGIQPEISIPDYSEWFTFTVPFKEGETVIVHNTYDYVPSYNSMGDVITGYVLQTGSTWKGKIGKARVEFKLGSIEPWQIEQLKPGGFIFEGNSIVWERKNIEPAYDLQVLYNTWHYSEDFLAMMEANGEDASDILSKIEKYQEIKQLAQAKDEVTLLAEYGLAAENRDSVLSAYIAGFLSNTKIPDDAPVLGEIEIIPYGTAYHISCDVKSLYSPDVVLMITHMEEGKAVIDSQVKKASTYIILKPEIEYDITVTVKDWLDRTAVKTTKFMIPSEDPGQEENPNRAGTDETGKTGNGSDETGKDGDAAHSNVFEGTNGPNGTVKADGTKAVDNDGVSTTGNKSKRAEADESIRTNIGQNSGNTGSEQTENTNYPGNSTSKDSGPNNKTLPWIIATVALGCLAAGFYSYMRSER